MSQSSFARQRNGPTRKRSACEIPAMSAGICSGTLAFLKMYSSSLDESMSSLSQSFSGHWKRKEHKSYRVRVLKKWSDRLNWGPGARTERAGCIGWVAPWPQRIDFVSVEGDGRVSFPLEEGGITTRPPRLIGTMGMRRGGAQNIGLNSHSTC